MKDFKETQKALKNIKEDKEIKEPDKLVESWNSFMDSLAKAKKAWIEISSSRNELLTENSPDLSTFARRCLSVYRRQTFEKMLPDFVKYIITAGGFNNNK